MKIRLSTSYIISASERAWLLQRETEVKSGKNAGEKQIVTVGYYLLFSNLIKDLARRELASTDEVTTLRAMETKLDEIARAFEDTAVTPDTVSEFD